MNLNLSSGIRALKTVITANSPVLLVGTAVAGVVATGVLAAKAGYKARGIVDAERMSRVASPEPPFDTFLEYKEEFEKKVPELSVQDKFKLTWLCYAAPAITGATTIASAVGVHTIHTKRHAALAGLYAVTSTKLEDYREKAEELLGAKKTQQLNDAVAQKAIDRDREGFENSEILMIGDGTELCQDALSGRWFMGSVNKVESAINEINRRLTKDGDASLNDYYDQIGLDPIPMGDNIGWSGETIEARFGSVNAPNGRPAIVVWFQQEPK